MFSRRKKDPACGAHDWHPSELARPPNTPFPGLAESLPPLQGTEPEVDVDGQSLARLDEAIATASMYLTEKWIPTTSVINPFLEVWEAPNAVHPAVARPVEEFLTLLIHRTTVTPAEINALADEVRVLALQASVLSGATKVS